MVNFRKKENFFGCVFWCFKQIFEAGIIEREFSRAFEYLKIVASEDVFFALRPSGDLRRIKKLKNVRKLSEEK